ncbi:MAG: hypothetical protein AAGG07_04895 [Planctomycetota bacterium]
MTASSAVSVSAPAPQTVAQVARAWAWGLCAAFVTGPIAAWLIARTPGPGGTDDALGLASATPLLGAMLALLALLLVGGSGTVAAWIGGQRPAMFVSGLVAAWASWAAGSSAGAATHAPSIALVLNGAGGGLAILALGGWLLAKGRGRADPAFSSPWPTALDQIKAVALPRVLAPIAIGAVAGGIVANWVLREPSPGQGFAAAWAGSLAGAVAVRFVGGAMQQPTSLLHCFVPAAVLCLIGAVVSGVAYGDPAEAVRSFSFGGLAGPTPAAWIAGTLLGAPLGARWFAGASAERP